MAQALRLLVRNGEVRRGRIHVRRLAKAPVEQRVMDRAHAASDVEEGRMGWQRCAANGGQELLRTRIGAAPAKPPRIPPSPSATELLIASTAMAGSHSDTA